MASNESTDFLLDLLYGELEEGEATEARAALREDPEALAELSRYESLLGRVREAMPMVEPSAGVRASILEAARQQAVASIEEKASQVEQPSARALRQNSPQGASLWNRINLGAAAQIAAVAGILIVGTFLFSSYQASNEVTGRFDDALATAEPTSKKLAEATPVVELSRPAAVPIVGDEELAALDEEAEATAVGGEELAALDEEAEATAVGGEELAALDEEAEATAVGGEELAALDEEAEATAVGGEELAALDEELVEAEPPIEERAAAESEPLADQAVAQLDNEGMVSGPLARRPTRSAGSFGAPPRLKDRRQKVAPAPPAAEDASEKGALGVSGLSESFGRSDYEGTIKNADTLLGLGGNVSATDRAQALEYKAQALEKLSRFRQADEVYAELQRSHPRYRNEAVARRRSTLREQVAQQAAREALAEERASEAQEEGEKSAKPERAKARRKPKRARPAAKEAAEEEYLFDKDATQQILPSSAD